MPSAFAASMTLRAEAMSFSERYPDAVVRIRSAFPEVADLSTAAQTEVYEGAVNGAISATGSYSPSSDAYLAAELQGAAYQVNRYKTRRLQSEALEGAALASIGGLVAWGASRTTAAQDAKSASEVDSAVGVPPAGEPSSATAETNWAAEMSSSLKSSADAFVPTTFAGAGGFSGVSVSEEQAALVKEAATEPWYSRLWTGVKAIGGLAAGIGGLAAGAGAVVGGALSAGGSAVETAGELGVAGFGFGEAALQGMFGLGTAALAPSPTYIKYAAPSAAAPAVVSSSSSGATGWSALFGGTNLYNSL